MTCGASAWGQTSEEVKDNSFQLYNILKDPGEYHNLAQKHPEVVQTLTPIFKEQLNSSRVDLQ